ncbi:hypothetical protein MES5069_480002 [Mesorhizobium escarrei]|uniref:Uncharacterized protein n=1 Tax=Mesorhizobium escarrei TaxID=666018 RepID=A0ABN8K7U0_9HYPH|nr:hypothetical protein MES5069_480002 [Mesorhizobium escarrei]
MDALRALAVTLANFDGRFWRNFEGDRQLVVRGFIRPGEPPPFLRQDAKLRADVQFSQIRSDSFCWNGSQTAEMPIEVSGKLA